eukprot:g3323.t1
MMKSQSGRHTKLHSFPHRSVSITQANLQPTRSFRRPVFLHFSFITASVLTATGTGNPSHVLTICLVFCPVFAYIAKAAMDSHQTSQEALIDFLKRTSRIINPRVEYALLSVDRRYFVDSHLPLYMVYQDMPLPIGFNETISAPHMHATCLELLQNHSMGQCRILDVGSGSGYLTAALAVLAGEDCFVLGVEKHQELANRSLTNIQNSNPELLTGTQPRVKIMAGNVLSEVLDEMEGFDVIHVGAAAPMIPLNLVEKLKPGGRMVIPVGPRFDFHSVHQ